jgi:SAM-dependent methyltransferase
MGLILRGLGRMRTERFNLQGGSVFTDLLFRRDFILKLFVHSTYETYVAAQRVLTAKKIMDGPKIWIGEDGIKKVNNLLHFYKPEIATMVCHGCRTGFEVNVFQKLNPESKVFGTDLYADGYCYDRNYFKEMDFDTVPSEWVGSFDVVYSNSIDHSRNPVNTLISWKSELKDDGICFVTFHCGTGVNAADCFRLDKKDCINEIREIIEKAGMKILSLSGLLDVIDVIMGKEIYG